MEFGEAIASGFKKYVTFSGRAARAEYWYWILFAFIVAVMASLFDAFALPDAELSPVNAIVSLGLLLPNLAVGFRRLHDIDRSAWWVLIVFTGIGIFLLIYWACIKGTTGPNRYGKDPLDGILNW
jgi:uncharacterized membrane protein YhaH (DUF805 family)